MDALKDEDPRWLNSDYASRCIAMYVTRLSRVVASSDYVSQPTDVREEWVVAALRAWFWVTFLRASQQ